MIDQFINFVIRPPRAEYDPDRYLWEKSFSLADRVFKRQDLELTNGRGHSLRCSHYMPSAYSEDKPLPCVVYCHGNSGCRADANEAAMILLPSNITVFTLDFSGSGLSDGGYVSLGWHEVIYHMGMTSQKDDLRVVVSYLRKNKQVSWIGLWGRSMGAVTSLLYGSEDPLIAGIVLDSPFSNLVDLMMDLVDVYKIRLPKFTIKVALQYMRRVIQRRAKFDIMNLNCIQVASKIFIPALFGHANEDKFIQPRHSDIIYKSYAGDKSIIKFDGDHNSTRPQFYYESVALFFYNTLHPPQGASTSSIDTSGHNNLEFPTVSDEMDKDLMLNVENMGAGDHFKGEMNAEGEEFCSYTSSARESWGRCSSLGGSDFADYVDMNDSLQNSPNLLGAGQDKSKKKEKMQKQEKVPTRREKFEKLEALRQRLRLRLRLSFLKSINHRKYHS